MKASPHGNPKGRSGQSGGGPPIPPLPLAAWLCFRIIDAGRRIRIVL